MRWDNLAISEIAGDPQGEAAGRMTIPLFEQGAVVRRFDTPEFRGITFYEVQAKSIINKVPEASHMPFRWTINPYRGCSHACKYCLIGHTRILMADGRSKPLADVMVGDRVYGTEQRSKYRHYVTTDVLAHWSTVKTAYRICLEDGTELIASADHRFHTYRGWKYVTGREQGRERRPFLTTNNELSGIGQLASAPDHSSDYRRGYLCGMIRGDGHVAMQARLGFTGGISVSSRFRLASVDLEALHRSKRYLNDIGLETSEYMFQAAAGARSEMHAISANSLPAVAIIKSLVDWPIAPTADWTKGFLAGIFDAEGSFSGVVRISNTDGEIVDRIARGLTLLGFSFVVEPNPRIPSNRPVKVVRLRGGLRECVRFFLTVDPAITRKRTIPEGTALKSDANLRVASIEPLGVDLPMYDITTGTGDFIANGVVSHNCFARKTHTYLDMDAGEDFNSQIVVKVNAPELLHKELGKKSWRGEHIAMGTNVDPYQRAEGRYRLMRGILQELRDAANPFSILTKGSLILRDIDLLQEAAERTDVGASVSVGFVDRDVWRSLEPGTPAPQKRLEVCRTLADAGIGCGVLMAPIIPFLTDSPEQLTATVKAIAEAGARYLSPIVLHLRPGAREWFMAWLRDQYPELVPKYERLYGGGSYAPKAYQQEISGRVHELAERFGIGKAGPRDARNVGHRRPDRRPPDPEQLALL